MVSDQDLVLQTMCKAPQGLLLEISKIKEDRLRAKNLLGLCTLLREFAQERVVEDQIQDHIRFATSGRHCSPGAE